MKQKTQRALSVLFWVLSAVCMGVIFWLSSRTATESTDQSNIIVQFLEKLFREYIRIPFLQHADWVFIVRKTAHCLEFTGLCLLLNGALFFTRKKKSLVAAIALTSLYAVSDEVHQLFVEGRSCELRDWGIDTLGAVLGALLFILILAAVHHAAARKNKESKSVQS